MFYVYILQSSSDASKFYVGITEDLKARMKEHNAGEVFHTAKFKPWTVKNYIAFNDSKNAAGDGFDQDGIDPCRFIVFGDDQLHFNTASFDLTRDVTGDDGASRYLALPHQNRGLLTIPNQLNL